MRILVTSDTHGDYYSIVNFIKKNHVDFMIHAGDYTSDAYNISETTGINYITVKGNNDYGDYKNQFEQIIPLGDNNILLVHGHKEGVYFSKEKLLQKALDYDCNIVIFGYTHTYFFEYLKDFNLYLLNPGSPTLPRDNKAGFVILEYDKKIKFNRIDLKKE